MKKHSEILILVILCLVTVVRASAYFEPAKNGEAVHEMNGIRLDQYPDFANKWKLVTVRYRKDSGELRFTYANEIAAKALQKLPPEFPDGAVLAKIGLQTEDDPSFSSSKVPSGAKRIQFMVKDAKKFASTEGWGFALFDASGALFTDEPAVRKTAACIACHRLVPERGYVFSRLAALGVESTIKLKSNSSGLTFSQASVKQFSGQAAELLRGFDLFLSLNGEIQKNAFSGTLDEIIPVLLDKSAISKSPASLFVDSRNFSLVIPIASGKKSVCDQGNSKRAFRVLIHSNGKSVRDAVNCN